MAGIYDSKTIMETSKPLLNQAKRLVLVFPDLEWELKKAGYKLDSVQFLSMTLYVCLMTFVVCLFLIALPLVLAKGTGQIYVSLFFSVFITFLTFLFLLFRPKSEITKRGRTIDRELEYMLKDMRIQLSSGVPLFDTLVNVGGKRYGECSLIADGIVQEVESGRSITEVLDDVGMWSPSEYLRNVLWQIVNAVRSGSDIKGALDAISNDIRQDKENRIKSYAQELNLWGLVYMMLAIVMPSMGVTLLVIMSSFLGGGFVSESLLWVILLFLIIFQLVFITYVKSKRPVL